jgi:PAS domain S-box-containing protein
MASILVLDDRAVERELLDVVLTSASHKVLHAATGEDALALAHTERPELIIADILMPGMDGYEFVHALRDDPDTASIRVILCTATYHEDDVRRLALACGVSHVLIKPVEPDEILRTVAETLDAEPEPVREEPSDRFGREQLRAANARLIEKVAALERAEEVRNLLVAIVESSDDAIIAKTLDGIVMSWNRGAQDLYGYSASEIVGKSIAMLVPPERPDELPEILARIGRGEVAHQLETVRVRKDGGSVDVALTISPIYNNAGKLAGAATIARDISVRKQAERELALAHRTAMETARAKSEFLTNMSHEMRTPLNGLIGMTGLLADTSLDQQQRQYVDVLTVSSEALLAVVSNVLDFSTLEAGRMQLDLGDFDLRELVGETMSVLAGSARAKSLGLGHEVDSDVPAGVRGDRVRLRQVLLNLLSNAVKFTAIGEVLLHVRRDGGERLHFDVSDSGVGIDDAQAASLFDAFTQADQSSTRRYGGAGLGLAISRELVQQMGGEIGCESRAGGGSTFWFTVPLAQIVERSATDG